MRTHAFTLETPCFVSVDTDSSSVDEAEGEEFVNNVLADTDEKKKKDAGAELPSGVFDDLTDPEKQVLVHDPVADHQELDERMDRLGLMVTGNGMESTATAFDRLMVERGVQQVTKNGLLVDSCTKKPSTTPRNTVQVIRENAEMQRTIGHFLGAARMMEGGNDLHTAAFIVEKKCKELTEKEADAKRLLRQTQEQSRRVKAMEYELSQLRTHKAVNAKLEASLDAEKESVKVLKEELAKGTGKLEGEIEETKKRYELERQKVEQAKKEKAELQKSHKASEASLRRQLDEAMPMRQVTEMANKNSEIIKLKAQLKKAEEELEKERERTRKVGEKAKRDAVDAGPRSGEPGPKALQASKAQSPGSIREEERAKIAMEAKAEAAEVVIKKLKRHVVDELGVATKEFLVKQLDEETLLAVQRKVNTDYAEYCEKRLKSRALQRMFGDTVKASLFAQAALAAAAKHSDMIVARKMEAKQRAEGEAPLLARSKSAALAAAANATSPLKRPTGNKGCVVNIIGGKAIRGPEAVTKQKSPKISAA